MIKKTILSCLVCLTFMMTVHTQCISSFPYNESFEANDGGWVSGGAGNDWAWGTPAKPVITSAATGLKCWIIGGLTASVYTNAEASCQLILL